MTLEKIYKRPITRSINPAVVAQDHKKETIKTEIEEYVFTDETINNLYKFLNAIKNHTNLSKTGVWINGYYGSGKSHFLKYVHYLIHPQTSEWAFKRLIEAVKDRDPFLKPDSKVDVSNSEINEVKHWFDKSEIETIIFNAQDVAGINKNFNQIFFNKFNELRGYNSYDIPLAVLLEKYLDERGVFNDFKKKLEEEEKFNWEADAPDIVRNELNTALKVAQSVAPNLDTEALRIALLNPETYLINVENFVGEVKEYIQKKNNLNYRLVFLVDEVSQFINMNDGVLLDLQSIIEKISEQCNRQAWIACTAQQTIDSLASDLNIRQTSDEYGKIMGRFETRISLESTDPAFITQKRILDKTTEAEQQLLELYKENKDNINNQFVMGHELYRGYPDEDEFILSYPFVPYQFKLIAQVFDAFQSKEFVIKEVKDNERSILKITHETAKDKKDEKLGYFVPFDAFFNNMMRQNLIYKGNRAISPALELNFVKEDEFAQRVVKTLFMISNLLDGDRQNFKPNLDNLTILLIESLTDNKGAIRNKVEEVLKKLIDNNIIREERGDYFFFNEDEAELSTQIRQTTVSAERRADVAKDILFTYLRVDNTFADGKKVMASVDGKHYYGQNGDIHVAFSVSDVGSEPIARSLSNPTNTLMFCIDQWFNQDKELRDNFHKFCQYEQYFAQNPDTGANETRAQTIANFKTRNRELLQQKIKPVFERKFNETVFISGQTVIDPSEINGTGAERYKNVLTRHLREIYKHADLVAGLPATQNEVIQKANEPALPSYELQPLSDAEKLVNDYISRNGNAVLLSDLISHFKIPPYGWKDVTIIYLATELWKRKLRDFSYANQPRYPLADFLNKAFNRTEQQRLSIIATEDIPQESINMAIEAWREIFNEHLNVTTDGNALFDELVKKLGQKKNHWQDIATQVRSYPFAEPIEQLAKKLDELREIRDPKRLFQKLNNDKEELKKLSDQCKEIEDFVKMHLGTYVEIVNFSNTENDNLQNMPQEEQEKVKMLREYTTKADPYGQNFRIAKKVYQELKSLINEQIKTFKEQTENRYTKLFDELKSIAAENKVEYSVFANPEYTINRKTKHHTISQFKLELASADNFFDEEREKILEAANRKQQEEQKSKDSDKGKSYETKEMISYKIKTPNKVLATQADVDNYIERIRQDLIKIINDNKTVIIK